jgi:hypothetical protein
MKLIRDIEKGAAAAKAPVSKGVGSNVAELAARNVRRLIGFITSLINLPKFFRKLPGRLRYHTPL